MPDQNRQVPTPAASDLPTYTILSNGQAISSAFRVMAISVSKAVNRISEAEIIILDGSVSSETFEVSNKDDFMPGKVLEIKAGYHQQEDLIFKGAIVKHAVKILKGEASVLVITLKHAAYKMTLARNNRIFTDSKDSEAIEAILNEYSVKKDVATTDVKHEKLIQYYSSDWDFVVMRAEMNGLVVVNENEKVSVKLPAIQGSATLSLYYGTSMLEFEAELDARNSYPAITASAWDPSALQMQEDQGSGSITEEGNFSTDDAGSAAGIPDMKMRFGGGLAEQESTKWASASVLRKRLSKIQGRARCIGFAGLQPGDVLGLNGVGDRFNGNAFVSGVHHRITPGKWETDIQFGMDFQTHAERFDNIAGKPAHGLLPAVNGLQIGIVAQLESDPKGEDRVLIKMPNVSESDEAVWARIATLDAGKDRGSFFRPEIGDEVIIGFLNDDPRNAIILGMLNSSKLPAPLPGSDDNHQKGFFTREKMRLLFDDEKKAITIDTPKGNKIVISEEDKGITITDENNNKWQLNDSGITIESFKDIKIKATGDVKIEGVNVEVKASANFKAEGSAGAAVKSSAITELKGSMVNIN